MANDSINDFLLDQELEGEPRSDEGDLPDDIDAILDAVEEEDLKLVEPPVNGFSDKTMLPDETVSSDDSVVTEPDLDIELDLDNSANPDSMDIPVNISSDDSLDRSDNIPLISDIIDPNAQTNPNELNDNLSIDLMTKIQAVVEQAISKEIERITIILRDNVMSEVESQLPAVISKALKSKT